VRRAFQRFEQLLHVVVTEAWRKAQGTGSHAERFALPLSGCHQAQTEKLVDGLLEGDAGAANLLVEEAGDIVIQRESGPHTMMLAVETS